MLKSIIKWVSIAACVMALAVTIFVAAYQGKTIRKQNQTIMFQQEVIDSLLNRRMVVFDVSLAVTDKSRFSVYGKYNKGTINVPSEKTYILEIDSSRVEMKPN